MDERVFLEENNIAVTNARFVVSGQTYAMSGIISVESSSPPSVRHWGG